MRPAHETEAVHDTSLVAEPAPSGDPVADLRAGWDWCIESSLRSGEATDADADYWRVHVNRIASTGRLAIEVERATELMRCASLGITFWLLNTPPDERETNRADRLREEVLTAILNDQSQGTGIDLPAQAVTLMASLETATPDLTRGERAVLQNLLERLARGQRG